MHRMLYRGVCVASICMAAHAFLAAAPFPHATPMSCCLDMLPRYYGFGVGVGGCHPWRWWPESGRHHAAAMVVNGLYAPAGSVLRHRTVVSYPSSLMLQDWLVRVNGFLFWLPIVKEWCLSLSLSSSFPSRAAGGRRSSACVPINPRLVVRL
ncbi:unnamed protein product [Prunus brigantina]